MDFNFYVGGIEDAILQVLESVMKPLGVNDFATYSGELDSTTLRQAISSLSKRFPLIMVSYTDGVDKQQPVTSPVLGEALSFRHDCTFLVVCASSDGRGNRAQRRGAPIGNKKMGCYQMISKVRELLTGLQIKAQFEDTEVLLTHRPLIPEANEFIARLPGITAYAIPFQTCFKWSSIDRSRSGTAVSEIVLGVNSLNAPSNQNNNVPGVKLLIGEKK